MEEERKEGYLAKRQTREEEATDESEPTRRRPMLTSRPLLSTRDKTTRVSRPSSTTRAGGDEGGVPRQEADKGGGCNGRERADDEEADAD